MKNNIKNLASKILIYALLLMLGTIVISGITKVIAGEISGLSFIPDRNIPMGFDPSDAITFWSMAATILFLIGLKIYTTRKYHFA